MLNAIPRIALIFIFIAILNAQEPSAPPPEPGSPADLVQQGVKLSREGRQDDALALYGKVLQKSPDFYQAHLESGIALDLKGDYSKGQEHLIKAVEAAPADFKEQALRSLAFSYAFAGNVDKIAEPELQVLKMNQEKKDLVRSAEICNELARLYLELGNTDQAYKWYKTGYDTINAKTDLSESDKSLWLFRWESAQARVAARKGNAAEAQRHVITAKEALDKANNQDQLRFYPYLTGYVAFYTGDYKTAITDFQKADQRDPLILALLGEAYRKSGDSAQAVEYYKKVLLINIHNPTNAFARPLAQKRLQTGA